MHNFIAIFHPTLVVSDSLSMVSKGIDLPVERYQRRSEARFMHDATASVCVIHFQHGGLMFSIPTYCHVGFPQLAARPQFH